MIPSNERRVERHNHRAGARRGAIVSSLARASLENKCMQAWTFFLPFFLPHLTILPSRNREAVRSRGSMNESLLAGFAAATAIGTPARGNSEWDGVLKEERALALCIASSYSLIPDCRAVSNRRNQRYGWTCFISSQRQARRRRSVRRLRAALSHAEDAGATGRGQHNR